MRVAGALIVVVLGCASSRVAPAPPAASASVTQVASGSASAPPKPTDAALVTAARDHLNVAIVRVVDHHTFVATFPKPGNHPSLELTVLRWIKGPSVGAMGATAATSIEARIDASDPVLRDGAVYVLVFDCAFDGKSLPSMLKGVAAKEIPEGASDVEANALEAALKGP